MYSGYLCLVTQCTLCADSRATSVTPEGNADKWSAIELTVPADGYKGVDGIKLPILERRHFAFD